MRAFRFGAALLLAALFLLFPFLSAAAGAQWCDTDPPVSLTQASGGVASGHLTIGAAGEQYRRNVESALVGTTINVTAAGVVTRFTVTVPGAGFATRVILSSGADGSGVVYGYAEGVAGEAMTVSFLSLTLPHAWGAQYQGIGGGGCSYAYGYCEVSMCANYAQTVSVEYYTWRYGSPGYWSVQYPTGFSCANFAKHWIWDNERVDAINVSCPGYCSNFQIWVCWPSGGSCSGGYALGPPPVTARHDGELGWCEDCV